MTSRRPSIRPRYRAPPVAEIDTHLAVVSLLKKTCRPEWDWTHFPAGEKRDRQTGFKLMHMGLQRGWPDFIFVGPLGELACLEIKSSTGLLEDDQLALFRRMRAKGVKCMVARSIDEAIRILSAWDVVRIPKREAAA